MHIADVHINQLLTVEPQPDTKFPVEFILPVPRGFRFDRTKALRGYVNGALRLGSVEPWLYHHGGAASAYRVVFMVEAADLGQVLEVSDDQQDHPTPFDRDRTPLALIQNNPSKVPSANAVETSVTALAEDHEGRKYGAVINAYPQAVSTTHGTPFTLTWRTSSRLERLGNPAGQPDTPAHRNMGLLVGYWRAYQDCPFLSLELIWTNGESNSCPGDTFFKRLTLGMPKDLAVDVRGPDPASMRQGASRVMHLVDYSRDGKCHAMLGMRSQVFHLVVGPGDFMERDPALSSWFARDYHKHIVAPSRERWSWCNSKTAWFLPNGMPLGDLSDHSEVHSEVQENIDEVIAVREHKKHSSARWLGTGAAARFHYGPYFYPEPSDSGYPTGINIWPVPFGELASVRTLGWYSALAGLFDGFVHGYAYHAVDSNGEPLDFTAPQHLNVNGGLLATQGPFGAPDKNREVRFVYEAGSGNGGGRDRTCFRAQWDCWDSHNYKAATVWDTKVRQAVEEKGLLPSYLGPAGIEGFSSQKSTHHIRNLRTVWPMVAFGGSDAAKHYLLQTAYDTEAYFNYRSPNAAYHKESSWSAPGFGVNSGGRNMAWPFLGWLLAKQATATEKFDPIIGRFVDKWLQGRMPSGIWWHQLSGSFEHKGDFAGYSISQGYQQAFVEFVLDCWVQYARNSKVEDVLGEPFGTAAVKTLTRMSPPAASFYPYKWCNYRADEYGKGPVFTTFEVTSDYPMVPVGDSSWSDENGPLIAAMGLRDGGGEQFFVDWSKGKSWEADPDTFHNSLQLLGVLQEKPVAVATYERLSPDSSRNLATVVASGVRSLLRKVGF